MPRPGDAADALQRIASTQMWFSFDSLVPFNCSKDDCRMECGELEHIEILR